MEIKCPFNFIKKQLEAKERSLNSGYNFKEKQDKIGKFSTSSLRSGSGSAKLSCLFSGGSINSSSKWCTEVTDPKICRQCIFQKSLCLNPKHELMNCKSNYLCRNYNRRHNIAIYQKDLQKSPLGNNSNIQLFQILQWQILPTQVCLKMLKYQLQGNKLLQRQTNHEIYWITFDCKLQKQIF